MIDKRYMYGTDHDPEISEPVKRQNIAEADSGGKILIESQGKKIEVVSAKEYDKLKAKCDENEKQIRMMKTEIQNMRKFINKMAKTVDSTSDRLEKFNGRFN